jgi:flagellar biosynthesis protein FliQ
MLILQVLLVSVLGMVTALWGWTLGFSPTLLLVILILASALGALLASAWLRE